MRIASLQPSITVTLADLGRLEDVVACTKYCVDVCPQAGIGAQRIIQDSWSAKAEEILAASPDLVIASVPYRMEAVAEIMKSGIRFLGLAPKSLADVHGDIRTIGRVVDAKDRAEELAVKMMSDVAEVRRRTAGEARQRVFCEEWGKPIIHSQRWVAELVEAAGGEFVGTPGAQTAAEAIRDSNPDVILAAWCGAGDRVPLEKIVRERGWEQTNAARTGRVYCIADELLNTPASTLIGGLRAIAWALHPEKFERPAGIRAINSPMI